MELDKIAKKANNSKFWNYIFNLMLLRFVPFNKPHRFWVEKLNTQQVRVSIPYIKKNKNHINGLHACSFATASEYASGLLLLLNLNPKRYRLIMESLTVDYHFQGKTKAFVDFEITPDFLENEVIQKLKNEDKTTVRCTVKSYDTNQNHLTTAKVNWQIKLWEKVKTKV